MKQHQFLSLTGSILLMIGILSPLASVSVAALNIFDISITAGCILIAVAIFAFYSAIADNTMNLFYSAAGVGCVLIYVAIQVNDKMSQLKAAVPEGMSGMMNGLMGALTATIHIQYGLGLFLISILLLCTSAFMQREQEQEISETI